MARKTEPEKSTKLAELLEERCKERNVRSNAVPTEWLEYARTFFTDTEISALIGTTRENISTRIAYAKKRKGNINSNTPPQKLLKDTDPLQVYMDSLQILYDIANSQDVNVKDADKLKAIDSVLKYGEAQVMAKLKEKFDTLNGLGEFIISVLIPQANKRIRELLREMEAKIIAGEDTKHLTIDLRAIFRELLPALPNLKGLITKQNWMTDDNG